MPLLSMLLPLLELPAVRPSSIAHSLKQGTSTVYGLPYACLSWSFKEMYARPKLPSLLTSLCCKSHALGCLRFAASASCCFCLAIRCASSCCFCSCSFRFFGDERKRLNADCLTFGSLEGDSSTLIGLGSSSFVASVNWNSRSLRTTSSNSCPMGAFLPISSQAVVTQCRPLSSVKQKYERSPYKSISFE